MASYGFFTTEECANNCRLCTQRGVGRLGSYGAGKTPEEIKGLENLLDALSPDCIELTGGDPLKNLPFLEAVDKKALRNEEGRTRATIIMNPISLLTLSLNKSAKRITDEDYSSLSSRLTTHGFSEDLKRALDIVSNFSAIGISNGNLQSPDVYLIQKAMKLFNVHLRPKIAQKGGTLGYFTGSGTFRKDVLISASRVCCVGGVLNMIERGEISSRSVRKDQPRYGKRNKCERGAKQLYFKKEEDTARLYISTCCSAGMTPYTSFKTSLTLDGLAEMDKDSIKTIFHADANRHKNSVLYNKLNGFSATSNNAGFTMYVEAAQDLIKEKTGEDVDIVRSSYSFQTQVFPCEVCHNVGIQLKKAKITSAEWQEYLENKYGE